MKILRHILIGIMCLCAVRPVMAVTTTSIADCDNAVYRKYHPEKCKKSKFSFAGTTTLAIGGTTALAAGAAALFGMSGGGGGGGASAAPAIPTLSIYNQVGGDVDSTHLAAVMNTTSYGQNYNQYNDIRLAYSLARGYTGRGTTIAVLDSGTDTWHGATVAKIASGPIAPDAVVESYKIANSADEFLSYKQIGDIIASATNANVYNASWSNDIGANEIHTRAEFERMTDKNFVNQMVAAADRDAIFVWAAGNDGKNQSSALSAAPIVIKELQGHFINVVAWDSDTGRLADYSNACGDTMGYCITAPGTNINAGQLLPATGTSFAAPIVSAAVAVIREAFPYMSAAQITDLLFTTARDLGAPGVDPIYGHGMLDLERATRPVGAPLVPLADNMLTPLRTARVSGTIGKQIRDAGIKFAFFDSYGRAFDANLNDNIKVKNRARGFERLRADENKSAHFGNIELGFKQSDFLLADGFLKTDGKNLITFIAANNSVSVGNTEIFNRNEFGMTAPRAAADSMITEFSNIYTASVTVGARHGDWTFSVAAPDIIVSGDMQLRMPTGRAANGDIIMRDYNISLTSRPAIEYSVGYKFITATFVDNPYGTDEFYVLAKSKIRF